ncbi:hypothetical protein J5X98_15660 [Leptothermofonsia sichuanensis E412]|uniref:hypothetical protein n=1 Tax=Leptothermofonsia sichuanensis TaxID=2917832 RepID=UPI001CA71C27|nr:hypothetical protein [Leptothermofonsia sichuanensis]QZZ18887.1 hypothetical protein J5X98_15660 [Leptothermofonsia sichuanensis E412]
MAELFQATRCLRFKIAPEAQISFLSSQRSRQKPVHIWQMVVTESLIAQSTTRVP